MRVLHEEDGQQEDINEPTDEEAREGETEEAKKLMAQGTDESEGDIVLGEWSSGPDSERDATSGDGNVIASMKVIRYGVSLKVIQSKRNFMVLIEFANS